MKRSAIILARCLAFVETYDLAPTGRIYFPHVAEALVARYGFQKYPKEFSEFDEIKGIEFSEGKDGDDVIERLVIYSNGILLDTRVNTSASLEIVKNALGWAKEKFGLTYQPEMIKRVGYISQLTFYSDIVLDALNPALKKLTDRITSAVSQIHNDVIEYHPTQLWIQHDVLKRKSALAAFTISPRIETPLSEHKYFSESPLPTDLHWELLEEFEANLRKQ